MRCLAWGHESVLFVGDLDGHVTQCQVGGACTPIMKLDGSVITMAMDNSQKVWFYLIVFFFIYSSFLVTCYWYKQRHARSV